MDWWPGLHNQKLQVEEWVSLMVIRVIIYLFMAWYVTIPQLILNQFRFWFFKNSIYTFHLLRWLYSWNDYWCRLLVKVSVDKDIFVVCLCLCVSCIWHHNMWHSSGSMYLDYYRHDFAIAIKATYDRGIIRVYVSWNWIRQKIRLHKWHC